MRAEDAFDFSEIGLLERPQPAGSHDVSLSAVEAPTPDEIEDLQDTIPSAAELPPSPSDIDFTVTPEAALPPLARPVGGLPPPWHQPAHHSLIAVRGDSLLGQLRPRLQPRAHFPGSPLADPSVFDPTPGLAAPPAGWLASLHSPTRAAFPFGQDFAWRAGWWSTSVDGDLTKVGLYQDLGPSPFWDTDFLGSDGTRTLDVVATGLNEEGTDASLFYFGPWFSADVDFQRYLHRLDHDPLTNFAEPSSGESFVREDLNPGEDYAIRVQEFRTQFNGRLTKNVKYRLNFWTLRKNGERQATAHSHCFRPVGESVRLCHVLSQRQQIDWTTVTIEPVIEGQFGPVDVEYSRPMRIFGQDDQVVVRDYGNRHGPILFGILPYALVPDNYTQIDRLKVGVDVAADSRFYANLKKSSTDNKFRDTHRHYEGFDLRLTNQSWEGVTLTAYAKRNDQTNQEPPFRLPMEQIPPQAPTEIRRPVNYTFTKAGVEGRWEPFPQGTSASGLSFSGGWEQGSIEREFAVHQIPNPEDPLNQVLLIDQDHTNTNLYRVGMSTKWSPHLNTGVWYKRRSTRDPLYGVRETNGDRNSSLPERVDLVEVRGNWIPTSDFLLSASLGIENGRQFSDVAQFNEDNYPVTCSLWYAPTRQWSLSAGYGYYSNWIDQDIVLPGDDPAVPAERRRFNYGGRSHMFSLGSTYRLNRRLTLSGNYQFIESENAFDPFSPWPDLALLSDVLVKQTRLSAGTDWWLRERVSAFSRYLYEDYDDDSVDYYTGRAHMFLSGLTVVY